MDLDLIRYLPDVAKISRQGQIFSALPNWSDLRTFEFNILLVANRATNFNNVHLCIPMQIIKKANVATDIDDGLITVNNFFAHFIK